MGCDKNKSMTFKYTAMHWGRKEDKNIHNNNTFMRHACGSGNFYVNLTT
jgi:hypothetical protein